MIGRLEWISLNTSCWLTNSLPLLAPINVFLRALMSASALHKMLLMTGWFLYYAIRFIHFHMLHCVVDFFWFIWYYLQLLRMLAVDTAKEIWTLSLEQIKSCLISLLVGTLFLTSPPFILCCLLLLQWFSDDSVSLMLSLN